MNELIGIVVGTLLGFLLSYVFGMDKKTKFDQRI